MKIYRTSFYLTGMLLVATVLCLTLIKPLFYEIHLTVKKNEKLKEDNKEVVKEVVLQNQEKIKSTKALGDVQIVFDGLTLEELTEKIERNLGSDLKGKGYLFASYATSIGLDPYLAVSVVLQETGCKWNCSSLVKKCYNVGGIKGSPSCEGSSYKSYSSLDDGIKDVMNVLYYNYYAKGLTTPELINPIYAEDSSWSVHVRAYMNQIKQN